MTDYWNDFYSFEQGGGGVICKVLIQTGYKTYATGFSGNSAGETFFPSKAKESDEQQAAKAKAQAQCKKHPDSNTGEPAAMDFGVMIRQYLETAARANGQQVGWNYDQFDFTANYHQSTKEIVMPSLKEHGIAEPLTANNRWEGWVRLAWQNDPYKVAQGKTRPDGTYNQIVYITEVFGNEDAARAAIGTAAAEEGVSVAGQASAPEGWDMDSWKSVWPELHDAKENGKSLPEIAGDYGVKPGDVASALSQYIPM